MNKLLIFINARPAGLELATSASEAQRSIQLSYGRPAPLEINGAKKKQEANKSLTGFSVILPKKLKKINL